MEIQRSKDLEDYKNLICIYCENRDKCEKDNILITNFNKTKNIKCLDFLYDNNVNVQ